MEIHHADRSYRNRAALVLSTCLAVGALGLLWLNDWLSRLADGGLFDGEERFGLWLFAGSLSSLLVLTCAAAAVALLRLARRISEEQRYPPNNMRTASDVIVKRGAEASSTAASIRFCAWFLLLVSAVLAAWGGWMLYVLS